MCAIAAECVHDDNIAIQRLAKLYQQHHTMAQSMQLAVGMCNMLVCSVIHLKPLAQLHAVRTMS